MIWVIYVFLGDFLYLDSISQVFQTNSMQIQFTTILKLIDSEGQKRLQPHKFYLKDYTL